MADHLREELTKVWPLFGLTIRTPRLELRLPTDDELCDLVEVAKRGVHDPSFMPFNFPWTDLPSPEREWGHLAFHWRKRASIDVNDWWINFGTFVNGRIVGTQGISATDFALRRGVDTGSWIGQQFQGQGIGTEMRIAVLHWAFVGLDAQFAESSALVENAQSHRVSNKLGHELNGYEVKKNRDEFRNYDRFFLTRDAWGKHPLHQRDDIDLSGFDACRELLGLNVS